jgi:Armadillo/beta-catenin-like repeat
MQPATTCSNALQVIDADALPQLGTALQSRHAAVQEASAWAAMHMAVHGAGIADQLAHAGVLPLLLQIVTTAPDESERCTLASSAMVEIVTKCTDIIPLLAMVDQHVPGNILFAALHTAQKILGDSVAARRTFVTSGALMALQALHVDEKGKDVVVAVNALFPDGVVKYYQQGCSRDPIQPLNAGSIQQHNPVLST